MKLDVLDTDISGFVQQRHPIVMQRLHALLADDEVVTTIITFGEDLSGWLPDCRRAGNSQARVNAYSRLQRGLEFYRDKDCLPFDEAATKIFDQLRAQRIRVGTNDLAIAAITLSVRAILVTRNAVDFQRVPGLVFEDWSR